MSIEHKATIRNWIKTDDDVVHGYFFGHPEIPEDTFGHTSRVVSCNTLDNGDVQVLTKSGNYYLLKAKRDK